MDLPEMPGCVVVADDGRLILALHRGVQFCDPDTGVMKIYCKNRALPDVLRSIGHELAHLSQGEKGEIGPNPVMYAGGYLEDDANARAGTMLKIFAKKLGLDKVYDE